MSRLPPDPRNFGDLAQIPIHQRQRGTPTALCEACLDRRHDFCEPPCKCRTCGGAEFFDLSDVNGDEE